MLLDRLPRAEDPTRRASLFSGDSSLRLEVPEMHCAVDQRRSREMKSWTYFACGLGASFHQAWTRESRAVNLFVGS